MSMIGDALRQAFMPKAEYDTLRDEDKAWGRLRRPAVLALIGVLCAGVLFPVFIVLSIVFPADPASRPFCAGRRIQALPINGSQGSDLFPGAFYLTEEEAADYFWMVVFVPSSILFFVSLIYLVAGILVAFAAPRRHGCLRVVENNYCASKRGGVHCLFVLNLIFAIIFGLLAVFLGSTLLTLGSSCSPALFWCYEVASWCLVILYAGTAFFLRRKAARVLDECDFRGRNFGLELLETPTLPETNPEMERRVNEGFKSWMGSSLLSSDEENDDDHNLVV